MAGDAIQVQRKIKTDSLGLIVREDYFLSLRAVQVQITKFPENKAVEVTFTDDSPRVDIRKIEAGKQPTYFSIDGRFRQNESLPEADRFYRLHSQKILASLPPSISNAIREYL